MLQTPDPLNRAKMSRISAFALVVFAHALEGVGAQDAYENPFDGQCATGESKQSIQGVTGSFCAPRRLERTRSVR